MKDFYYSATVIAAVSIITILPFATDDKTLQAFVGLGLVMLACLAAFTEGLKIGGERE